jgi:para-aminobenzoate synthetase component 1
MAAAAVLTRETGTLLLHSQRARGRSALLFDPRWVLRLDGDRWVWSGDVPAPHPPALATSALPFALASRWTSIEGDGPVFAGLAGFLAYDLGPAAWGARHWSPPPFSLPDLWLAAYDTALVFDARRSATLVVADLHPLVPRSSPLEERMERAIDRLRATLHPLPHAATARRAEITPPDPRWHRGAVEKIRRHLRAGDVYQVNLTAFTTARTTVDPWPMFAAEARRNPVDFAGFLRTENAAVVTHSPERLLRVQSDRAETAPIKGTIGRARGDLRRLLASEKDRAEHVMIVDLCRNDLGRVCEYGSVRARRLMRPLRLHGLVHLVTRIEGRLRPASRSAAMSSLFPGGSITGAPKRRAMEIITTVERSRRGPYTGSLGFVDRLGHADWNIAIRTAIWQNEQVAFGSGGGIVLDSDPDLEYAEARLKAASFFETLDTLSRTSTRLATQAGER